MIKELLVSKTRGLNLRNGLKIGAFVLVWMMGLNPSLLLGGVGLEAGWTRGVAVGSDRIAVYGIVTNDTERPVEIVDFAMPGAAHVMLHESVLENGRMRMRHIDGFVVPPQGRTQLEPLGLHLMVMGLDQAPDVGDRLSILAEDAGGNIHELVFTVQSLDSLEFEDN